MNLGELENELKIIISDPSLEPYLQKWLNDAVEELATDFDLPGLRLVEPVPLPVNAGAWLYDPPANYHKNLFQARDSAWQPLTVLTRFEEMDRLDVDHDEAGDHVTHIAATEDGRKIGIFPKAAETIRLWFFEKPAPMSQEGHEPVCIPKAFRARVLIPKVVIKNFKLLQDLMINPPHQSLQWWEQEYKNGLFGSPRGEIGMLNYFAKARKPRRYGGRDPLP